MIQKTIDVFVSEYYLKPPKKKYLKNKTDFYHIDDIWNLNMLVLKDYGLEKNRGNRYVLVVIDNFSKFGWFFLLKNKNAQTIKDSSENILMISKRYPNLMETDRGRNIITVFFNFS